jgi:hypothetical protein
MSWILSSSTIDHVIKCWSIKCWTMVIVGRWVGAFSTAEVRTGLLCCTGSRKQFAGLTQQEACVLLCPAVSCCVLLCPAVLILLGYSFAPVDTLHGYWCKYCRH